MYEVKFLVVESGKTFTRTFYIYKECEVFVNKLKLSSKFRLISHNLSPKTELLHSKTIDGKSQEFKKWYFYYYNKLIQAEIPKVMDLDFNTGEIL